MATATAFTAAELLENYYNAQSSSSTLPSLDSWSIFILQYIVHPLDQLGLATVNLNWVGLASFLCLAAIRHWAGQKRGIDWYPFLHSVITGWGAVLAFYLDYQASATLTALTTQGLLDMPEPLRSCLCVGGPLTALHRIVPAITMGYSLLDLLDGSALGFDFALHGFFTLAVMLFYVQTGTPQILTPFIVMEMSSIHLNLIRADFLSKTASLVNQCLFALTFFIFRVVITPIYYAHLTYTMWQAQSGNWKTDENDNHQWCHNAYLFPFTVLLGMCFHCLNGFWFYKIVRKMKRKLSGTEAIQAKNGLADEAVQMGNKNTAINATTKKDD